MPPGPFISGDSRVVTLLNARSFHVLLDDSLVDKAGTLDGTYMPSLALFGGHRPLAFLDAADPHHATLKCVMIRLAAARMHHVAPSFGAAFTAMFDAVEIIGDDAAAKAYKWLVFQLHPLASKAVKPWFLEDLLLHTFRLPAFLVRRDYAELTAYFADVAAGVLDDTEKADPGAIPRDELLHNLVFLAIFNSYGGYMFFLPHLVKWLARGGPELHARLAGEVRGVVPADTGKAITLVAVEKMPLVKSVVWEALRMNPPVEFQYGRARRDTVVESHDAAYKVKKGEMLFGYQTLATRDEHVFKRGGEFVPDRFVACGDGERRRMLDHVVWSNGPETAVGNKQCPRKDMVVAVGRLMVAELFRRYDTFTATVEEMPVEPVVTFTSLTRAAAAGHGTGSVRA
ncbi:Allene oxide synthase 4 [Dichanthelium oligosanthes]|uniref:Allene oxide synthase 4 n=1 Tax=Dichanthelium oligosanthes TaxID=888268 RepID=A0A1E5UXV3_9POAL|nr:Allene oxide synthase 4 [Dichanthelium oligosanthes]